MANEADLKLIQIPEFPKTDTLVGSGPEYVVLTKADGVTYGMLSSDFKAFLGTVQVQVPKALAPTDPAPTLSGVYYPTINGTYANAGGIEVNTAEGGPDYGKQVQLIYDGSDWVKVGVPLPQPDLSGLATKVEFYTDTYPEYPYTITPGAAVGTNPDPSAPALAPGTGRSYIGWIDVSNIEKLIVQGGVETRPWVFRDENMGWVGMSAPGNVVSPIPAGAKFAARTYATTAIVENPETFKIWLISEEPLSKAIFDSEIPVERIEGHRHINLVDIDNVSQTQIVSINGELVPTSGSLTQFGVTDLISVKGATTYITNYNNIDAWLAEYDINGVFLGMTNGKNQGAGPVYPFTTKNATAFIRMNMLRSMLNIFYITTPENEALAQDPLIYKGETFTWLEKRLDDFEGSGDAARWARFKGKKLQVAGDSITEKNVRADKHWWEYLDDFTDFAQIFNEAKSGTGLIKNNGGNPGMIYRLPTWPSDSDFILIMGNMNDGSGEGYNSWDWIYGASDVWKGDFTTPVTIENAPESLWSTLRYLFEYLIANHPTKPIGFITSTPRGLTNTKTGTVRPGYTAKGWGADGWFAEWADVIKVVANNYSVPVLDLYRESGLRPWNSVNNDTFFKDGTMTVGDKVHPNTEGQRVMGQKIIEFVAQYL